MKRALLSSMAATIVLLVSGAAFSGNQVTTQDMLVDYDKTTGDLWGYPKNQQTPKWYLHDKNSQHAPSAVDPHQYPPGPCRGLAIAWDAIVDVDKKLHQNSTAAFAAILETQAKLKCNAVVTSTSGTPAPVVVIAPAP